MSLERAKFLAAIKGKRLGGTINNWGNFGNSLIGRIEGDKIHRDACNDSFITSKVVELNEEEGWVETNNSFYSLGKKRNNDD